ncbi:hypothetical protein [Mycobacterium sp.]|uniref:hypothetical protein n=1 Tax=Mycobacterium sp. TaxID=1785 RepID=UPI003C746234
MSTQRQRDENFAAEQERIADQKRQAYLDRIYDMAHADVLDALQRAVLSNRYGSHDDMIADLRSEILKRMTYPEELA